MKSNDDLGFVDLVRNEHGYGKEATVSLSRTESLNLSMGRKVNIYRADAYQWHHEQDASREGVRERVCGRGATIDEALRVFRGNAVRVWSANEVDRVIAEYREMIEEAGVGKERTS